MLFSLLLLNAISRALYLLIICRYSSLLSNAFPPFPQKIMLGNDADVYGGGGDGCAQDNGSTCDCSAYLLGCKFDYSSGSAFDEEKIPREWSTSIKYINT